MIHWTWFVLSWVVGSAAIAGIGGWLNMLHQDERARLRAALIALVNSVEQTTEADRTLATQWAIEQSWRVLNA